MSGLSGGRSRGTWWPWILTAALVAACLPTDEGGDFGELRVRPIFESGSEPAAIGAEIDSIRTVVRRAGGEDAPLVDQVRSYEGSADILTWLLELRAEVEDVDVELDLRDASRSFYHGRLRVTMRSGALQSGAAHDIAVAYVGPTLATRVEIAPVRAVFTRIGARLKLVGTAYDDSGDIIEGYDIEWSTHDPGVAVVNDGGEILTVGDGSTFIVAAGATAADSMSVLVDVALARRAGIRADPESVRADGEAQSLVMVEVRDEHGELVGVSAGTVALRLAPGGMASLGPIADHGDGTYTATLTAGTTAGRVIVTGTLNGDAMEDSAEVVLTPGDGDLATTTITANPGSRPADGASTALISVDVRDAHGNLIGTSAGEVELSLSPAGLASLDAVIDHGDGTYTATLTAGTTAGIVTIAGTLAGEPIEDDADVELTPGAGDPTTTTITADPQSVTADGISTSVLTVEVQDVHGNLVGESAGEVELAVTPAGLASLDAVIDHGDGTYTATLTAGTTAGIVTIAGTLAGEPIEDDADVELTPGAGDPTTTTITADPGAMTADGVSTSLVTVEVRDAAGNLVGESAGEVELAVTPAGLASLDAVIDHGDGTYTATLTAGTTAGIVTIAGTLAGEPIEDDADVDSRPARVIRPRPRSRPIPSRSPQMGSLPRSSPSKCRTYTGTSSARAQAKWSWR